MQISMLLNYLLLSIVLLTLQQVPTYAAPKHYIIYLGSDHANPRLSDSPENVTNSHHDLISLVLKSDSKSSERIIYSYNKIYNGLAAILHEEEANELAKHPSVVSIFESRNLELATTRSSDFLGLHYQPKLKEAFNLEDSIWQKASLGEDMILANVDTGVWPESQSFSDEGYGPIPKKFTGTCANEHDPAFKCNRKLIGARYFYKGMVEHCKRQNCSFNEALSPRDDQHGHGTHTLSTAGGNFVQFANMGGLANGTAKGMAPKARLVAYKTGWNTKCPTIIAGGSNEMDLLAAFEAAIDDGVDIINFSLGLVANDYFTDAATIGTFHAMKNGILTIICAGNIGPKPGTVSNPPWVLTVAASTMDREFSAHVILGDNRPKIKGIRYFEPTLEEDLSTKLYPLITGADARMSDANINNALLCQNGTLDSAKVTGKILVCRNTLTAGSETLTSIVAREVGAVGMVLVNEEMIGDGITLGQMHAIPTVVISYKDGETLFAYINSTRSPSASISKATSSLGIKPSPIMGSFSSRGPNQITPGILKPDITAPGVDILAAYPPHLLESPFSLVTGTSMAAPHIAGIATLIKKLHPDWSTAAIKSAIMTTASPLDNTGMPIRESDKVSEATPFAYGSGHVRPNLAMDPGLVYDMNHYDYFNFLCSIPHKNNATLQKFYTIHNSYKCPTSFNILDLNYPSISIIDFTGNAIVTRKLKNVGQPGTYVARIEPPPGVSIVVEPKTLVFSKKDQTIMFKLIFTADVNHLPSDYIFGSLVWSDAKHVVRSPIMVKAQKS